MAATVDGYIEDVAGMLFREGSGDGVDLGYLFAVDGGDEVAANADFLIADHDQTPGAVQASRFRRGSLRDFLDQQSASGGKLQRLRHITRHVNRGDAEARGL